MVVMRECRRTKKQGKRTKMEMRKLNFCELLKILFLQGI